jgi:separase
MDLAKPSTTLSSRLRFNRVLADATYVYSLLSTVEGSYKDAAKHARQCVALNRRIWAATESRATVKKAAPVDGSESDVDGPSKVAFDPLSSMRNDKGAPIVMSVTHDALSGPEFWSLVPALYRGLMQHSQIFAHQGLLHEAIYVAEQAEKVASASQSPTLMIDNASWRADCWAQSGRPDKAQPILDSLATDASRRCLSIVGYQSAVARIHHWTGQYEEEVASYTMLDQLLKDLTSPVYIRTLDTFSSEVDNLVEQMSQMTVDATSTQPLKSTTATRGRKPATKAITAPIRKTTAKPASKARTRVSTAGAVKPVPASKVKNAAIQASEAPSSSEQCSILHGFQAELTTRRVLAHLLQEELAAATSLIAQIDGCGVAMTQDLSRSWATFKTMLAQSTKQIAENIAVNTLPESTIAFPAINSKERTLSEDTKRPTLASSKTAKVGRAKKPATDDFTETLRNARNRLVEAHAACAANGPNYMFQQVSMALGTITVLLSAVSGGELGGSLHPLYAAYMGEVPKSNALRLTQESVEAEKEPMSRDECLRWPTLSCASSAPAAVSDFQKEYIDIMPETWTAVSLALNDTRDELFITRYESGVTPFLLRLPLARHASRDMDEEEFSFEDGKRDFDEIIELSDFSTRTAKDMTSREARQQWWTEREALDTRLHELLINMENIWLGGFKGIFSQHERQPSLLARFRKSLENILNQHLPSRRKKTTQKRPTLDTRVLELFIGLGDANDEELDLDEALMDLIYFVVDILHFNGERNAYDEIDFDAMVVETQEALQAYHSAGHQAVETTQHTILILDNNLHGFPWESLPCLEMLSISRLPSLAALRERLLSARQGANQTHQLPGHYIRAENGGTSILNPSGDLSHTSKTLKPRLDELHGPWTHIANRAPTEKEFEDSLREKDLVLYFGHGSGAQFVRSKAVRRLYPGQQDDHSKRPGCATTFLFGCSSVHLTENGIYEPSGMLASYLTAGAPAVVGMLWDVTDKDCDRFAIKAGELWGLWPEPQEDAAPPAPKTPGRKTKGKGRIAQLVDEVEGARAPGSARKGKKVKIVNDEAELAEKRRRGLGLDECVREARKSCVLRYLNGAAAVVYGIPVYLE